MSFESCIKDAVLREDIKSDEAEEILGKFRDYLADGLQRPRARAKTMEGYAALGRKARLQKGLTLIAKDKIDHQLTTHIDHKGRLDPIGAAYGLWEDFGYAGAPNVRFLAKSINGEFRSKITNAFDNFRRKTLLGNASLKGGRRNIAQYGDLQRALYGEGGSPEMQALAKEILDACDWARMLHNDYSGDAIPKLENWGGPQVWEPFAVNNAGGFRADPEKAMNHWVNDVIDEYDWAKMRDAWTGELFGAELPTRKEKVRILRAAWGDIVAGRDFMAQMNEPGNISVANMRSQHRFFVYKDAEAKMRVMQKYGNPDLIAQIEQYGYSMSRDIASMMVFGPNPKGMNSYIKSWLQEQAQKKAKPHLGPSYIETWNKTAASQFGLVPTVQAAVDKAGSVLDGYYEQFFGNNEALSPLAQFTGTVLANHSLGTMIGSATLAHAVFNPVIQMWVRYLNGVPVFQYLPHMVRSFGKMSKDDIEAAGLDFEQAMFDLQNCASELDGWQKFMRWSRWWPDRTTHLSGLNALMKANRDTFARDIAGYMGKLQPSSWATLPPIIRSKMEGYGLTSRDWDLIKMAELYRPTGGGPGWLVGKNVAALGLQRPHDVLSLYEHEDLFGPNGEPFADSDAGRRAAAKQAQEVGLKLNSFYMGMNEESVPQSAMRSKIALGANMKAPAFWRFMMRSANMFHSFQGSFVLTQFLAQQRIWTRNKASGIAHTVGLLMLLTLCGVAVHILKQLRRGMDAPSIDPSTPEGKMTWVNGAAIGAIPYFGDVIAQDMSKYGLATSIGEMMLGPMVRDVLAPFYVAIHQAQNAVYGSRNRRVRHEDAMSTLAADIRSIVQSNTPILSNLWYASAPYNRMGLDQMQQALKPSAHENMRMQQRKRDLQGRTAYWPPGEVLPTRWPRFQGSSRHRSR